MGKVTVYRRRESRFWWLKWIDGQGLEQRRSSETEDEAQARALAAEIERQEAAAAPTRPAGMTVARFCEEVWLPQRKLLRPYAWKADESRLRMYFLPVFGARPLAELGTDRGEVDLLDWLLGLRRQPCRRGGALAPRTIRNAASIVRVFCADALERKRIARNPTTAWRADRHLPAKEDKVKGWRHRAGFSLEQVVTLTTGARIPEERRVLYALRFLSGLRPGEAAAARWRDLDRTRRPLARLTLASSFNSEMHVEKATKTGAELNIPVHPVLQELLDGWEAEGWRRYVGRAPGPADLIVPGYDGAPRNVSTSLGHWHTDLAAVGLPEQRQYESRSTFRNLALQAGASEFHLNLITHPKPVRASDFYTRLEMQWAGMCAAVEAIDAGAWRAPSGRGSAADGAPAPSPLATVTALRGGYSARLQPMGAEPREAGKAQKKPRQLDEGWRGKVVTPTGLEPMSST